MAYTIALYGAGQKSLQAELRLRRHMPSSRPLWLVENRVFSKLGEQVSRLDGAEPAMNVVSLSELARLHASGHCQIVCIPGAYHLFDLREARSFAEKAGFAAEDIRIMPYICLAAHPDHPWTAEEVAPPFDDHPFIYSLDVHVVDHCNCSCRSCSHFSNLVNDKIIYDPDEIHASLIRLAQLVPDIANIWLLGGEPLLHPQLDDIVRSVRNTFPFTNIAVITNGILLNSMSHSLIDAMRECDVAVTVSLYPPLQKKVDAMVSFLRNSGLRWNINRCDAFEKRLFCNSVTPKEQGFVKCGHDMCLRGSHLGYCVIALFTDYFNARFGRILPEDSGIDIYSVNDGRELLAAVQHPLELCAQCVSRDAGQRYTFPWQSAGTSSPPRPEDWFISNT